MTQEELLRLIEEAAVDERTELNLAWQELSKLPAEIGQLNNLKSLDLRFNQLTTLPPEIGQLSSLKLLDLRFNQLTTLPPEIGQLSNVRTLHLSFTQLTRLPESVGQLSNLQALELSANQLTTLPESVGQLSNLKTLELSANQLTTLPESVGQLINLQWFSLSNNQLTTLPKSVGQLSNLQMLSLSNNQLATLPKSVGQLINLQALDLRFNQLTTLPESAGQLINLQWLELSANQLTMLPGSVGQLSDLQMLFLGNNQLTALPESVGQLSDLQVLSISNNQLTALPESVGQLSDLQVLSISNNQLTTLPKELQTLAHLNELDLRRNPLPIPPEILGDKDIVRGNPNVPDKILKFYFQTKNETMSTPLYEAKFLIVGEGEAGKTTLAKKLTIPDYDVEQDQPSTEGIDVIPYEFDHSDGHPCRVNIWDFGGQEIYHATHQFFLSDRAVYALVVDSRKENPNFYYWLRVIQLHGANSPVIIIKNEKQDRPCTVNDRQLRSEFENLEKSIETNFATNRNLENIKSTIAQYIGNLPHMGDRIPTPWAQVRAVLENLTQTRNYIDLSSYRDICCQYGITEQSEQNSLSQFLHDLGICLHFQKNIRLKRTLFLKPEWSTEAAYKVLNNKQVRQDCGRFCDADLLEIWSDPEYTDMQGELLALMKAFEVCYEITGRQGHYIAPHLLEPNPPTYDIPWESDNNLTLTYRYTFKPRNILPRFIVALHEFIEYQRMVWKHGVVLSNNIARAEITEDTLYHNADIRIRISGQDKKQWLSVVAHHLERINASFDTLDYKILVPCPCPECKARTDPFEFTYEQLKNARNKGRPIQCLNSLDTIDARYLIDDVIGPQLSDSLIERLPQEDFSRSNRTPFASEPTVNRDRFPPQNYQEKKTATTDDDQPVKVFLSYARQDGPDAAARLRQELMDAGFNVWQDTENMRGGEAWKEQLRGALREVDAVLVLLTPSSVTSEYVKWEWEGAQFLQKLLIPVLISPCEPPPDLHRLQRRDLSTKKIYIKGLMSIVQDLNRC